VMPLLAQEQAWRVDINDGVRVNVAPLQVAGLLASDVLAGKDLPKAIAAPLRLDGRGRAGESGVDGARAGTGEGEDAVGGEAAEGGE